MNKKIGVLSRRLKNLNKLVELSSYLKRRVYSKSGEYIGKVYDVLSDNMTIEGVLIKGKKNIFIGKEFFQSESKKAIVLNIEVVLNLFNKKVYDSVGRYLGIVKKVLRKSNSNTFSELIVKKSFYKKPLRIKKKEVSVAKKNIILNKEYEETI